MAGALHGRPCCLSSAVLTTFILTFLLTTFIAAWTHKKLCYVERGCYMNSLFLCPLFDPAWVEKLCTSAFLNIWQQRCMAATLLSAAVVCYHNRNLTTHYCLDMPSNLRPYAFIIDVTCIHCLLTLILGVFHKMVIWNFLLGSCINQWISFPFVLILIATCGMGWYRRSIILHKWPAQHI